MDDYEPALHHLQKKDQLCDGSEAAWSILATVIASIDADIKTLEKTSREACGSQALLNKY